jgi:hypothetical protein
MMANGNGNGANPPQGSDYLYDVFLSYSFKSDVKDWVAKKFSDNFRDDLESHLIQLGLYPPPVRVFIAPREIKPGDVWPNELKQALLGSKVLVAICSPHYFVSGWCQSEWKTFEQRAPELIMPVLYYGTDEYLFPKVYPIQYTDFREFKEIPGGRVARFKAKIEEFACAVAAKVKDAPEFSPSFPSVLLAATPPPNVSLQVL